MRLQIPVETFTVLGMNLDAIESATKMYFDMPASDLQKAICLADSHGVTVEYPISGDALARIRATA